MNFNKSEEAITTLEYALVASLIALGILIGITSVGNALNAIFTAISAYF